ncbi:MFS transporter [Georgenia yuyongxinii]|uniref:Aromatic acid/H+ symport family MFS transporter n=1 Tax=Georgenia yuyongxinii TaxID=2589797 RepID=A0A552WQJ0_9MICO|nr:MFS transporter [Georgenia yuyongxinii]TRW44879.1 aromatic acid/H+ symport family MFS transporter [Georgenia yuyongxinii]
MAALTQEQTLGTAAADPVVLQPSRLSPRGLAAVVVAWLFVVFDGYDLIVYGTVQARLREEWALDSTQAGTLGSVAFLGMTLGALGAGRLADHFGRKRTIIGSAVVLSVFTALCAVATDPVMFGALRLLAGLGLGGLVPSANALAADLVPLRWRAATATMMMSGVPIGGSLAALVGIPVIPAFGWRPMFAVALVALLLLVPLAAKVLPNDAGHARAHAHHAHRPGFGTLLRAPFLLITVMFALATVVTLMAWYGLGTWLPNLMEIAGYDLGSALTFALALNLGAVVGSVATAWAGDRFGTVPTGIVAAALAGVALLTLITQPPVALVYLVLVLAGVGTHGTQALIIAAIATYYPANLRGTALGFGLGVGRVGAVAAPQLGGLLLAAGLGVGSNFLLFGGCAVVSAVLLAVIWRRFGITHDADARAASLTAH